MASANNSFVGLAKQTAKGTIQATDNLFKYIMFKNGSIAPNSQFLPSDDGIGGGALQSDVAKVGVFSAGAFELIPRPDTLGRFLIGALGKCAAPVIDPPTTGAGYKHVFTFNTDQYDVPYFTVRSAPGGVWGETFKDMRISALGLNWRAADYIRGAVQMIGGTPTPSVNMGTWSAADAVDRTPALLAPTTTISTLEGVALKVLRGQFVIGNSIPLDEQWITGSYSPDGFDIVQRQATVAMLVKIDSESLYKKIAYDAAAGAAWTADILKEADFSLTFASPQVYDTASPYKMVVKANASALNPNVAWSVEPIALQDGRSLTMAITGTFLASSDGEPITVELYNDTAVQY